NRVAIESGRSAKRRESRVRPIQSGSRQSRVGICRARTRMGQRSSKQLSLSGTIEAASRGIDLIVRESGTRRGRRGQKKEGGRSRPLRIAGNDRRSVEKLSCQKRRRKRPEPNSPWGC